MTEKSRELWEAYYDYCVTNRIIAFGEVPSLNKEEVEKRCREQYEKDVERIRRKYEIN